jgi:hypothetical protein
MKLTELPTAPQATTIQTPVQVDESVEAAAPQDLPGMYGIDPKSAEGVTMLKRLKRMQKTDPALYARIMSMD